MSLSIATSSGSAAAGRCHRRRQPDAIADEHAGIVEQLPVVASHEAQFFRWDSVALASADLRRV
jgi:hypothetical protein